jgi:hypothetical protein
MSYICDLLRTASLWWSSLRLSGNPWGEGGYCVRWEVSSRRDIRTSRVNGSGLTKEGLELRGFSEPCATKFTMEKNILLGVAFVCANADKIRKATSVAQKKRLAPSATISTVLLLT